MLQPFCNMPNSCTPRAFTQTTSLQQTEPSAVLSLKNFNSHGDKDTPLMTSHRAPAILTRACSFPPWLNSKLFNRRTVTLVFVLPACLMEEGTEGGSEGGRKGGFLLLPALHSFIPILQNHNYRTQILF